jgi:hypothetical protein
MSHERGTGAFALMVALVITGVLAVIVLLSLPSGRGSNATPPSSPSSDSAQSAVEPGRTASGAGSEIHAAAVATCQADYEAVLAAVSYYQAANGSLPTSLGLLRSWLRDPVSSADFSIAIDPHNPGVVEVGTKARPLAPGEANCNYAG